MLARNYLPGTRTPSSKPDHYSARVDDLTISQHLADRLRQRGVDRGFGIVGDYALRLFADLEEVGFPILVTADEQGAAFAADAYARLKGLGVVAVTYGVDNDGLDAAGNLSANRFFTANQVTNWGQVVSARVELVLAGAGDSPATATQPYVFAGETVTPTDKKLRTVMSMLVSLRNTVP